MKTDWKPVGRGVKAWLESVCTKDTDLRLMDYPDYYCETWLWDPKVEKLVGSYGHETPIDGEYYRLRGRFLEFTVPGEDGVLQDCPYRRMRLVAFAGRRFDPAGLARFEEWAGERD